MIYNKEITREQGFEDHRQCYVTTTTTKHYIFGIHIFTTGIKTIG